MLGNVVVDPIRALIFAAAHLLGGSLGWGILSASAALRLALLPLTLRVARRQNSQQRLLRSLKPELAALEKQHGKNPAALWRETNALHQRAGYRPLDPVVTLGNLARLPVLGGLFGAIRSVVSGRSFAWIADLAQPNAALAILVATASGAAGFLSGQAGGSTARAAAMLAFVGASLALAFSLHFSAGVVLSWGANAVVDIVQGVVLVREQRRSADAT